MAIKRLAIWVNFPYEKDKLFDVSSPLNRDNCLSAFRLLKDKLFKKGWECHTQDIYKTKNIAPDGVLFLDIPSRSVNELLGEWTNVLKCVVLQEPEIIIPRNWDIRLHNQFDKILTWNDSFVDDKKYFKFNYGNVLLVSIPRDLLKKEKLCTLIAGNCKSEYPLELYSERREAIRWFEDNHPDDFDFYGRGWNEYLFQGVRLWRGLNRIKFLTKILAPKFSSYKGIIDQKQEVLRKYRFSICYENSTGMLGYISEKIFDCFVAGCVPVYWGASNISDHIPKDCFIDKREFKDYEALYAYMKNMSDEEYLSKLNAIEFFLNSEKGNKFSVESFAKNVIKVVLN